MSEEERGNWIYIGPAIPPLGLHKNALYRTAELPAALKLIAARKPVVRSLYIKTEDLAVAKININRTGSLEHTANLEMLALAKTTPR